MTQEELLRLPKVELHCHLDGSLSQEFIEKRLGRSVKKEELSVSDDCTSLAEYLEKFKMMEEKFSLENDIRVSTLSRYPEVLTMEEKMDDEEELWKGLKKALDGAIAQFVQTRTVEGENLKKDLIAKLDGMLELVGQIEERAPKIIAEYREKLEGKVKELLEDTQIDEGRIA